ncbi:MAG TPA: hypothetical protein VH163_09685 [Gemmatimonadales bacterium]|nr:hypothetical protein [Gemmatimonadales bacterium]
MAKTPSKGTVAIQRLLEERRQLESWIARIDAAADATPAAVRGRVRSDYETRLITVIKELKNHMEAAREVIAQRRQVLKDLQEKEADAAEALSEAELRHAVGEYDEGQWTQVHKEALSELVSVREELQVVQVEVEKLEEIDALATDAAPPKPAPRPAPPPAPEPSLTVVSDRGKNQTIAPTSRPQPRPEEKKHEPVDELAFLKSVTEDARGGGVSPRRASGAQYQPAEPGVSPTPPEPPAPPPMATRAPRITQETDPVIAESGEEPVKTLKCKDCGTMNLPTEWYCENCGAELAAL